MVTAGEWLAIPEILHAETCTPMGNVGARTVADLGPRCVRPTMPPGLAPWPVGSSTLDPLS